MLCFHYDPESGTYSWAAIRFMQFGGALTLIILAGMLTIFWAREWRKAKRAKRKGRHDIASIAATDLHMVDCQPIVFIRRFILAARTGFGYRPGGRLAVLFHLRHITVLFA